MILSDSLRITAMIPPMNHKMYPPMTIGATDVSRSIFEIYKEAQAALAPLDHRLHALVEEGQP